MKNNPFLRTKSLKKIKKNSTLVQVQAVLLQKHQRKREEINSSRIKRSLKILQNIKYNTVPSKEGCVQIFYWISIILMLQELICGLKFNEHCIFLQSLICLGIV